MLKWLRFHAREIGELWAPLTSIFANLLVVAALLIAFLTYQQQQRQATVSQSMSYIDRFNSGEMLAARNLVFRSWIPHNLEATGNFLTRETLDDLVSELVGADDRGDGAFSLRTALVNIVAFFDGAYACIGAAVCDASLLENELGVYGHDFYCLYQGFIGKQATASRLSEFGLGVEFFATRRGDCSAEGQPNPLD